MTATEETFVVLGTYVYVALQESEKFTFSPKNVKMENRPVQALVLQVATRQSSKFEL